MFGNNNSVIYSGIKYDVWVGCPSQAGLAFGNSICFINAQKYEKTQKYEDFMSKNIYGMAAVVECLEGLKFPTTKQYLLDHIGDKKLHWNKGEKMIHFREVIEQSALTEFHRPSQVIEAVEEVLHKEIEKAA